MAMTVIWGIVGMAVGIPHRGPACPGRNSTLPAVQARPPRGSGGRHKLDVVDLDIELAGVAAQIEHE